MSREPYCRRDSVSRVLTGEPARFVHEALRHRGYEGPVVELRVEELALALAGVPGVDEVRGVCSRVRLRDDTVAHLPLLDFQCEVSEACADAITAAMGRMRQRRGALLLSGRSYHYYGFDPLNPIGWRRFMSRTVLLTAMIDVRYVAHCLIEDLACLRVDSHVVHPVEPVIVKMIGNVSNGGAP